MSQDKTLLTQNSLNESINNIVTERAQPLHAHSQFVQKFQRQLQDKRITSFGSMELRITNYFSSQNKLKSPGPGSYNIQSAHYNLSKKPSFSKQPSFGTTLQRFKPRYTKGNPGPGTYHKEKENKKKMIRREPYHKIIKLNKSFNKTQQFPGPGSYKLDIKNQTQEKRIHFKNKLSEIKEKRQTIIHKFNSKNSQKPSQITNNPPPPRKLPVKHEYSHLKSVFKLPSNPLERSVLQEKTKKYLPQIKHENKSKNRDIVIYNFSNNFIEKKDRVYESHFQQNETSDPGVYFREKQPRIFKKKSSFFMSESKRNLF